MSSHGTNVNECMVFRADDHKNKIDCDLRQQSNMKIDSTLFTF